MQVHGDNMIRACYREHVCNKLGWDWSPALNGGDERRTKNQKAILRNNSFAQEAFPYCVPTMFTAPCYQEIHRKCSGHWLMSKSQSSTNIKWKVTFPNQDTYCREEKYLPTFCFLNVHIFSLFKGSSAQLFKRGRLKKSFSWEFLKSLLSHTYSNLCNTYHVKT